MICVSRGQGISDYPFSGDLVIERSMVGCRWAFGFELICIVISGGGLLSE